MLGTHRSWQIGWMSSPGDTQHYCAQACIYNNQSLCQPFTHLYTMFHPVPRKACRATLSREDGLGLQMTLGFQCLQWSWPSDAGGKLPFRLMMRVSALTTHHNPQNSASKQNSGPIRTSHQQALGLGVGTEVFISNTSKWNWCCLFRSYIENTGLRERS